jgi:hypothetical protein
LLEHRDPIVVLTGSTGHLSPPPQEFHMWRKATIGGLAALAIVAGGAGITIAQAAQASTVPTVATADPTPTPSPSTTDPTGKAGRADKGGRVAAKQILGKVKDFQHAEWVTKVDNNTYVTHEAILGRVTAVSSTSITVKSTDGTSMTFAVTADTKVHQRQKGSTTTPTIADIKTGQTVLVGGEKSPDLAAKNIVARAT